jgi:hypothetical protein
VTTGSTLNTEPWRTVIFLPPANPPTDDEDQQP